jgi:enterochelin esterase-like enzyme
MPVAERLVDHGHPLVSSLLENPSGEAGFWMAVEREGTPLIEADPAAPGHSIVTYVFAAPQGARHVVVQPGFGLTSANVMSRVPGTGVCHASYRYRNDVRASYSFAPDMPLVDFDEASAEDLKEAMAFLEGFTPSQDPHAREHFVSSNGAGKPESVDSFLSLPEAPDQALVYKREGVGRGRVEKHTFASALMGNERNVWVYTPPGYEGTKQRYPLLVAFDGGMALARIPTHRILDNLTADGRVAPTIVVLIDNPTDTSRNDELPCNETFAEFVEEELFPWLHERYRISERAQDHFVTGASYGGLAAMWFGFRLPHLFGNVLSQAASLWWGPGFRMDVPRSAGGYTPGWLIEQYAASPRLPVRFWMEIGLMEHPKLMLEPNRRMKAVLEAKGYDLTYSEPCGGHDTALWRGTLADALAKMLPQPV